MSDGSQGIQLSQIASLAFGFTFREGEYYNPSDTIKIIHDSSNLVDDVCRFNWVKRRHPLWFTLDSQQLGYSRHEKLFNFKQVFINKVQLFVKYQLSSSNSSLNKK